MPRFLSTTDSGFAQEFDAFLNLKRESDASVGDAVAGIINAVRADGDDAVARYTSQFDNLDLSPDTFAFSQAEIDAAANEVPADLRAALELAADRIRAYHEKQLPEDAWWTDQIGAGLGWRWTPVDAVGLYVPGGQASYPSSVLMSAIPAKVAGVPRVVMTVPTPDGAINPAVLFAAKLAGVQTVYRLGGAQAVAALAYGTQSIEPVVKITGPGNAYVAEAKRQVFGQVGIDMIAGPSEVLVIADKDNRADWLAMDLLSQAEHDASAQSILITDDAAFGQSVAQEVSRLLGEIDRSDVASASWDVFGAVITVRDMVEAADLTNRLAPEHLEICTADADAVSKNIRNAGAIFLGSWTPEAVGDYIGGPNHVLPTARSARFSSGLSVLEFMKRTTLSRMTPQALAAIGPAAETLAASEGLGAHGASVGMRLASINRGQDDD